MLENVKMNYVFYIIIKKNTNFNFQLIKASNIRTFIHSFGRLFVRSFVRSFIHLFIHFSNYIGSLISKTAQDIEHHRRKRQAGFMGPENRRRVPLRKEIRMMSDRERELFFRAVDSAKRNTVGQLCHRR